MTQVMGLREANKGKAFVGGNTSTFQQVKESEHAKPNPILSDCQRKICSIPPAARRASAGLSEPANNRKSLALGNRSDFMNGVCGKSYEQAGLTPQA